MVTQSTKYAIGLKIFGPFDEFNSLQSAHVFLVEYNFR